MSVVKRKRKKNPYCATVWVSGLRVSTRSFETQASAYAWHDQTKRSFEQGYGPMGEMTFAEVMATYTEKVVSTFRVATRGSVHGMLKLLAASPLATVQMADFNGARVDQLIDWMIKHPKAGRSNRKSFIKEVGLLVSLFNFYREYYDERTVCPVTKRHRKRAYHKGAVTPKRKDFYLSPEDAYRWFEALARSPDPVYQDLARFQVIMGTRVGEAAALCWDAVDFDHGTIEIRRTMEWRNEDTSHCRRIENRTKTPASHRTLPMPKQVEVILKRAKARDPHSLVVFRTRRGLLLNYSSIVYSYNRAFAKAGLPWSGSHICRNTNGTLALEGSRIEAVQVNLGHTSVRQTEVYAKVHAVIKNVVPMNVANLLDGANR